MWLFCSILFGTHFYSIIFHMTAISFYLLLYRPYFRSLILVTPRNCIIWNFLHITILWFFAFHWFSSGIFLHCIILTTIIHRNSNYTFFNFLFLGILIISSYLTLCTIIITLYFKASYFLRFLESKRLRKFIIP